MRPTSRGPGSILVFGENRNDSRSVRELLLAANATLDERRVKALPKPMSLTRDAKPDAVRKWVDQLDKAVRGHQATGPVSAVVVHRDADGPDLTGTVEAALTQQISCIGGKSVVPVQMIEAWWFLFPDAIEAVRPAAWRGRIPRKQHDVELIAKPKDELRRATRTKRAPEYSEADSPVIAGHVRRLGLRPLHPCASYDRMTTMARGIR